MTENKGVSDALKYSLSGEKFLFFEKEDPNGENILIFTTYTNLIHFENSPFFVADGTFYCCPTEYSQLYTFQAPIKGKFYPLIFCLMEKSIASYDIICVFLKIGN